MIRRVAVACVLASVGSWGCDGSPSDSTPTPTATDSNRGAASAAILTGQRSGLAVVVSAVATAPRGPEFATAVGVDLPLRWVHVAIYQLDAGESFAFGDQRPRLTLRTPAGTLEDITFGASLAHAEAARTAVPALALESFGGTHLRQGTMVRALAAFDVEVNLAEMEGGELRVGGVGIPLQLGRIDVDGLEDLWEASSRELVVARLAAATAKEPEPK